MNYDAAQNANTPALLSIVESDSGIASQTALCCVAMFSTSLSDQSKVVASLENMQTAFHSKQISILRVKQDDAHPKKIVQVGTHTHTNYASDAVITFTKDAHLCAGTAKVVQSDIAATLLLIVLQVKGGVCDIAQFAFAKADANKSISALTAMAPALAIAWSSRQAGLATALAYAHSRTRRTTVAQLYDAPILGLENAYGLSRSEFRVCLLLASGLKPKVIAEELDLSIATIRTHLRNIYAKTEMSGQVEVISHIGRSSPSYLQAA